jgi:hypothetical protein
MSKGKVGEDRGSKETDRCPLTMCWGCSSDNNQMNMTFQVLGAGMISLSVAAGVA